MKGNTGELYWVLSQLPSCYPEYVSFDCPRMLRVLSRIIADEKQAEVEDPEARRLARLRRAQEQWAEARDRDRWRAA